MGLFSAITEVYQMAPCDWFALARTGLTPTQFSVWYSEYTEHCCCQAAENNSSEIQSSLTCFSGLINMNPLKQAEMYPQLFSQCSQAALCALKMVLEAKGLGVRHLC